MKIVNFEVDSPEIQIVPLADLHIGSPQCDELLIKETCEYIANTPNCYTILNGDVVDNTIRNSVGDVFEQTMSPMNQVTTATYYLSEIAAKKKIINFVSGNHELRTEKESGLSPSDLLLAHLMRYDETLNERYCADGAFTFLSMKTRENSTGKICYTIFNLHGNGGGSKIGGKIQRLEDMAGIIDAHIYIRSHTHQPETHRGIKLTVDTNNHTVREEPCVFVNTGAFLKYGGYGARAGMKPLSRAIPVITIKNKRKTIQRKNERSDTTQRRIEVVLKDSLED